MYDRQVDKILDTTSHTTLPYYIDRSGVKRGSKNEL